MWVIMSKGQNLIAYHEKRKVIEKYFDKIRNQCDGDFYVITKLKTKQIKKIRDYYDYYLLRYGDFYVPAAYYCMIEDDYDNILYEYNYVIDIIQRIIEIEDLTDKERKNLVNTAVIIKTLMQNEKTKEPDMNELKRRKLDIEMNKLGYDNAFMKDLNSNEF